MRHIEGADYPDKERGGGRVLWKFPLTIVPPRNRVTMPIDSVLVAVGLDPAGDLCLWAEVYPDWIQRGREFVVIGTGHKVPDNSTHRGHVVVGPFVWHVYEMYL